MKYVLLIFFFACAKLPMTTQAVYSQTVVQPRYLTAADFDSSRMRGFNLSTVHTLAELKAKDLPGAKTTGANFGRYWLTISHRSDNSYYFSDRNGADLGTQPLMTLDSAVKMAEQLGFYLVVTLKVRPDQAYCDLWGNPARKEGVKKVWQQLATRYKGKTIISAYDLINEPRAPNNAVDAYTPEYITWTIDVVKAIRTIDPNHTIAIEVLGNSMLGNFSQMNRLFPVYSNLIASPHGYSYLALTHQGSGQILRKTYPGDYSANYFPNNSYFKVMLDFKKQYPKVPIWIGEFSCINWAPLNKYGQWTSTRWINDLITFFEANNISWAYHAWKEYEGWDAMIPSSYYVSMTFKDGAPYPKPSGSTWRSQRTLAAPTITMLSKNWFSKNIPL